MFVLEVTNGPSQGQSIELIVGTKLIVGRSAECHIGFDDPQISSHHAEVVWTEDGFALNDLDSLNGTFVNGARVRGRTGLRLGDFIQVGDLILRLREVPAGTRVTQPQFGAPTAAAVPKILSAKTMMVPRKLSLLASQESLPMVSIDDGLNEKTDIDLPVFRSTVPRQEPPRRTPSRRVRKTQEFDKTTLPAPGILSGRNKRTMMSKLPVSNVVDGACLERAADLVRVIDGPAGRTADVIVRFGETLDPFSTLPVTFGREKSNGVILEDDAISLRHMVVDKRDGHYEVRDVGSSNGTFVNGERVVQRRLKKGDVIGVGRFTILVVLGKECLGLEVGAPAVGGAAPAIDVTTFGSEAIGVVASPLGERKKKRRKKKASELVWFATSDLDRGVYRARSALVALFVGMGATVYLLATGSSSVLAGGELMTAHESMQFEQQAQALGHSRCTSCHVGVGRVSTLKCLDCHPFNRPKGAHADVNLACFSCHFDHRGTQYSSAASASFGCVDCHHEPHEKMIRTRPRLVARFRIDATADDAFHMLHHIEQDVLCTDCHGLDVASGPKKERGACGQCHAPDGVVAGDCQQCHKEHPDRSVAVTHAPTAPKQPPRFRTTASLAWGIGLIVVPFLIAALLPRKRKVTIDPVDESEDEDEA